MARPTLTEGIAAVDRLNSWVRSESFRNGVSNPRDAIYDLKRQAIRAAHADGRCTHRMVRVDATCRDCGGDGRYKPWWADHALDHCRACESTGTARLRFVETTIADPPLTWHSPYDYKFAVWPLPGVTDWYQARGDELPPLAEGWGVNQPGRDLSPAEAARALNMAEAAFPERVAGYWRDSGGDEFFCDPFGYKLWVGETPEGACVLCDGPIGDHTCGYIATLGRVCWTAHACAACDAIHRGKTIWTMLQHAVPHDLIRHPDITEWIVRHPAKERPRAALTE